MKLKCKYNKVLTKDLYPRKQWYRYDDMPTLSPEYTHAQYEIKQGSFIRTIRDISWRATYLTPLKENMPVCLVNIEDVLLPRPEYKEGYGCCDVHWAELYCGCGLKVAEAYLDCWQDRHVEFDMSIASYSY